MTARQLMLELLKEGPVSIGTAKRFGINRPDAEIRELIREGYSIGTETRKVWDRYGAEKQTTVWFFNSDWTQIDWATREA